MGMSGFTGFFRKEINEILKTSKLIIMPAIFLFFGFLSPLTAKYINELIKSMGGGIVIKLPEPTYLDSYSQFFKNLAQTGVIVVILVFMSAIVDEKVRGSVILVLTKNVSRSQFILCKFLAGVILFTFAYMISIPACLYYTCILFRQYYNDNLWLALLLFWIYGIYIISMTILASTVGRTHVIAAVAGFIGFALTSASTMIPFISKYTPGVLNSLSIDLLTGARTVGDAVIPVIVTVVLIFVLLLCSVAMFKRQEL